MYSQMSQRTITCVFQPLDCEHAFAKAHTPFLVLLSGFGILTIYSDVFLSAKDLQSAKRCSK